MYTLTLCWYTNGGTPDKQVKVEKFAAGSLDNVCKFLLVFDQMLPTGANIMTVRIEYSDAE
jgi:hypothetical protein